MEHVLIIEDDERTATFVVGALQQAGFATTHCRDGEEGLSALLHNAYDVAEARWAVHHSRGKSGWAKATDIDIVCAWNR